MAEEVDLKAEWARFCDSLKEAGELVFDPANPQDGLNQAEGVRYLTRLTRMGLENFVEFRDPLFPVLRRSCHETIKQGGDNPDNHYANAAINPAFTYRITGTRGTVHYLGFGTQEGNYGKDGGLQTSGYLDARDMEIAADGSFEIIVAPEKPALGNWLPMSDKSGMVLVRQTFGDFKNEKPAECFIERIGADGDAPKPMTPGRMARGLTAAHRFVTGSTKLFLEWTRDFEAQPVNKFERLDPARAAAAGGDPNIQYYYGPWDFAADEALVIESDIPTCDYWNIQLNNFWMESLDYRYLPITLNHKTAEVVDGKVRIVLSHDRLGVPNAITTGGHEKGILMWRWIGADQNAPVPTITKTKIGDLS